MMKNMNGKRLASVVVDAGGTSTSWAFNYKDNTRTVIETESFHPFNFNETFFSRNRIFLKNQVTEKVPLYFFGAGMGKMENKQILSNFLQPYFSELTILTDIQGLVLSLGMDNGAIAIMGTGSVLVEILNGTIRQQIGGLGHLLGDEGSAYYFGRLVLTAYFDGQLSENQISELQKKVDLSRKSKEELLNMKYEVARLAADLDQELFHKYHIRNIDSFFKTHFDNKIEVDKVAFVGSYAFFQRHLISKELQSREIDMVKFIRKPIELFCDKFAIY